MVKLFDAHCHLQDPRIFKMTTQLIRTALDSGVVHFAVNGVSEKDWHLVMQMSDQYPCIIPCFGVHPWYVAERTPNWLNTLKECFEATPSAAVGEIGLDKGSRGRQIDFMDQVEIFRQQLELAKELNRPATIHCVRAFGDLLQIMKSVGPFPAGVILHSFLGSAEMVPGLAELGAYFSFSGFLMSMKESKAKRMLKAVPAERILLETDAPDALPKSNNLDSLFLVEGDASVPEDIQAQGENSTSNDGSPANNPAEEARDTSTLSKEILNHPANIHNILSYVASLLEMTKEELADISYGNAMRLFSYEGSKVLKEGRSSHKFRLQESKLFSLQDGMNSASSMTQTLSGELADGQRKLLALAGANPKAVNPLVTQLGNGPFGVHEKIEAPLDPTKELSRMISEHKYEEAFTAALQSM
ncbi:hypothetical protein F0562_018441 [Nyssa sinensis]|uniref:TatD related DNase n=1 Tax=Nyssa sinensis TaxID=561372 RepID=A0A5J4ZBS6_9ASTE|nr:hypothetical protein F0562_018441 [Nyssa sinensis]